MIHSMIHSYAIVYELHPKKDTLIYYYTKWKNITSYSFLYNSS